MNIETIIDTRDRSSDLTNRIDMIDVIRGIALLGILLMNIKGFGQPKSYNPTTYDGVTGPNFMTWKYLFILFEGKMRALFSMLFGAGIILFCTKKEKSSVPLVDLYFRRILWLLFFGLVNAYVLLWWGDILYDYAICGLLLFAFRNLNPKIQLAIGISLLFILAYKANDQRFVPIKEKRTAYLEAKAMQDAGTILNDKQQATLKAWDDLVESRKADPKKAEKELTAMHSGYLSIYEHVKPIIIENETRDVYQIRIWELLGTMLIGMALFQWGFFSGNLKTGTYLMLTVIGFLMGIPVAWYLTSVVGSIYTDFSSYVDSNSFSPYHIFVELQRVPIAIATASVVIIIYKTGAFKSIWSAMSCVGRMAFTNYLMQSIICGFVFYGYGLGYFGKLQFYELYYVVIYVWIFQIMFSVVWMKYFSMGPLEWVWRSLTYWKIQSIRKSVPADMTLA